MKRLLITIISVTLIFLSSLADTYIVNVPKANVRSKASTTAPIIGSIQKGMQVEVLEQTNGFARFDFMGTTGYTAMKLLKKVEQETETPTNNSNGTETIQPETVKAVPQEEATLYIFYDMKFYLESLPISFNGQYVFGMEGKETTSKMTGTRYEPSMRKVTIHGEGKLLIALDYTLANKPYHSELTIDIADGGTYFVHIHMENMFNAITKKRGSIYFKPLKPKEGLKMLKNDKFTKNPDFDYILQ